MKCCFKIHGTDSSAEAASNSFGQKIKPSRISEIRFHIHSRMHNGLYPITIT
jgi:hypothetical protein